MENLKEKLHGYLKIVNEQIAEYSNAYYSEPALNRIIEAESQKIEGFDMYLKNLDKKHGLYLYASLLANKYIHDFADKVPYNLLV
jgi:hypothetical protein